jgi:putative hydroxymethylpyrimidine transport system substrate-binding protein
VRRISVVQEYFHPWPNSAGFYLARARGWYEDADIDFELRTFDPGRGDALEYLARGEASFAVFPSNRLLVRREARQPLVAVAAVNQRALETLRTRADSGIDRLRDLEGRRIAYNPTPRGHAIVRSLIASDGGDPNNYVPVNSGARELDPADGFGGVADATFGSYWAWDNLFTHIPPESERVWKVDEALGLRYHGYLLGTNESLLESDPDLVNEVVQITARGFEEAARNPDEVAEIYERVTPYFAASVIRRSIDAIATTWLYDGKWGTIRQELVEPYAEWLRDQGILTNSGVWKSAIAELGYGEQVRQESLS